MEEISLKNLFQQEFARMVAVISKLYGLQHIELAEDIVSETFLQAAESWGMRGIPQHPAAWLYTVAKNKALYHFRRGAIFDKKVAPAVKAGTEIRVEAEDPDFSPENIRDSQLRMLFAVCNPVIASEAQIGLALRILCGFGIDEIAEAFLTNKETINKRLYRAKEKLREEGVLPELPGEQEIVRRVDNVLHVIYLLFSEGYYSRTQNAVLQKELCLEALRLGVMLTEYPPTNLPKTNALIALMCFHASRFDARQRGDDPMVLYAEQEEERWDQELIGQGWHFLNLSAAGSELSSWHLEARIAAWHCRKEDSPEKWEAILGLYDQLLGINYSPVVALHRVFALYKVHGREAALAEAGKLGLENYSFYHLLLGELWREADPAKAAGHLHRAYELAGTDAERQVIRRKIGNELLPGQTT